MKLEFEPDNNTKELIAYVNSDHQLVLPAEESNDAMFMNNQDLLEYCEWEPYDSTVVKLFFKGDKVVLEF